MLDSYTQVPDKVAIDALTTAFFRAFSPGENGMVDLEPIKVLFLPEARIVKTYGPTPEVYTVEQFIEPRAKLLNDGTLTGFEEHETSERTEIFGCIAHRWSTYEKSWTASGERCAGSGVKTIQFVRIANTWKISSLAWDDDAQ